MTLNPTPTTAPPPGFAPLMAHWKLLVTLGCLMILLSAVAFMLVAAATLASVLIIGSFMSLIGIAEIVIAFSARTWGRFLIWALAGLLYLVAGVITISQPAFAASFFTLFLGAGLIATGAVRLLFGFGLGAGGPRGMVVLAGLVTLFFGLLILAGWPGDSLVVLGALLSADLLIYGVGWLSIGLALRSWAKGTKSE
ncbi:MAG: hypothetical protein JWO88_3943 [Frankiales bacterium]|nr:hypothetical protein [Frankiales bacterium]